MHIPFLLARYTSFPGLCAPPLGSGRSRWIEPPTTRSASACQALVVVLYMNQKHVVCDLRDVVPPHAYPLKLKEPADRYRGVMER